MDDGEFDCLGRVNRNFDPCPGVLDAVISPPCISTIARVIASPSPLRALPSPVLLRDASGLKNGFQIFGRSEGSMPDPVSVTSTTIPSVCSWALTVTEPSAGV